MTPLCKTAFIGNNFSLIQNAQRRRASAADNPQPAPEDANLRYPFFNQYYAKKTKQKGCLAKRSEIV